MDRFHLKREINNWIWVLTKPKNLGSTQKDNKFKIILLYKKINWIKLIMKIKCLINLIKCCLINIIKGNLQWTKIFTQV
jgi:hypothetical protein